MTTEINYAYLQSHPLFANIGEHKILEAASMMKVRTTYRGESLSYGDGEFTKIYLLVKGKIKLAEFNNSENELIKDIITAPDIFGDLSMDGRPSKNEYAEALTANTVVCVFATSDFKKLLQEIPMMALAYAIMVNGKLRRLEHRHADLVFCDAKSRLIRFIKNWAQTDGNKVGNKIILNNYLTHTDIANVISTSRQSVNVLLNELRQSGVIFYDRKRIELNFPMNWN